MSDNIVEESAGCFNDSPEGSFSSGFFGAEDDTFIGTSRVNNNVNKMENVVSKASTTIGPAIEINSEIKSLISEYILH
jgi:hypothetical protein